MSDSQIPPSRPPAGFYPDSSGTMRWWDGNEWTEHVQASVPPPAAATPPAGWHPDPRGGGGLRYWDGSVWTEHVAPGTDTGNADAPANQATSFSAARPAGSPSTPQGQQLVEWAKNHKGLSSIAAVVLALILIGSLVPADEEPADGNTSTLVGESTPADDEEASDSEDAAHPEPASDPEPEDGVPAKQAQFIALVEEAAQKAESGNEFQVVNARKKRGREICALMPALKATNWVGEVEEASTELGGDNGVVMLRITDDIAVGTWNNSLSDFDANSMIKPSSPLYDKLGNLSEGDSVTFSGKFVRGPDCLEEQSLVDENGVLTPDFTFRFSAIR
jgi:hypothetical protein